MLQSGKSAYSWTSIAAVLDEEGRKRIIPRKLIVAEIQLDGKVGYAMEIERKPGKNETISVLILAKSSYGKMTLDEFNIFIKQCVEKNRWPTREDTRIYLRESVSHKPLPDESLGKRMAAALINIGLVA